jgi:hypothetical protein
MESKLQFKNKIFINLLLILFKIFLLIKIIFSIQLLNTYFLYFNRDVRKVPFDQMHKII